MKLSTIVPVFFYFILFYPIKLITEAQNIQLALQLFIGEKLNVYYCNEAYLFFLSFFFF